MHHHSKSISKPIALISCAIAAALLYFLLSWMAQGNHEHSHPAHMPQFWGLGIIPFLGILGAIALFPLLSVTKEWWENNLNRFFIAMLCAGGTIFFLLFTEGLDAVGPSLEHAIIIDYIPFIVLLFSLYVISGGIQLTGDLEATPKTNTMFLGIGALLASFHRDYRGKYAFD